MSKDMAMLKESEFKTVKGLAWFINQNVDLSMFSPDLEEELMSRIREVELEMKNVRDDGYSEGYDEGMESSMYEGLYGE